MPELLKKLRERVVELFSLVLVFLLLGLTLILLGFTPDASSWVQRKAKIAWTNWTDSEPPRTLAVFPDSTVSRPMVECFDIPEGQTEVALNDGTVLELLYEDDDLETTARKLHERLLTDQSIVLVIGHERSTTAMRLIGDVYENDDVVAAGGGLVPLILPAVTNPQLTRARKPEARHIIRLPATDDKQVAAILHLLDNLEPQPERIVLVVDNGNRAYSGYIARELISIAKGHPIIDAIGIDLYSAGFSPTRFLEANPDTVVFIGMEVEAMLFLKRLKFALEGPGRRGSELLRGGPEVQRSSLENLRLVFTDGVAGDSFRDLLSEELEEGEHVFLTGPFPSEVPPGTLTDFPTYRPYACLAMRMAETLISRAKTNGRLTRKGVLIEMQGMLGEYRDAISGVNVRIDENGENQESVFHIYDIGPRGTVHSASCPCAG